MFKKIAIAGVGLIGGSIALALKERFPDILLIGITRDISKLNNIPQAKVFDKITDYSNLEVINNCDFCLISTIVSAIPETFRKLNKYLNSDTVITDVGSIKSWIVSEIKDKRFVGSHPMAGSEKSGLQFANPKILENSICVVTPKNNPQNYVDKVCEFWNSLGMKVILLSPEIHDKIVAQTSHFIHLVSYLISFVLSSSEFSKDRFLEIFGRGLLDTTRISKSDPYLWVEIFQKNKDNLLNILNIFIEELIKTRDKISENRWEEVIEVLSKAKNFRDTIG